MSMVQGGSKDGYVNGEDMVKDFRDYNVRVWSGDVFINSFETIGYSGGSSGEGAQTPTEDRELHKQIMDVCRNIAKEFLKLDDLINQAVENNGCN